VNFLPANQFNSSLYLNLNCGVGNLTNSCQPALDLFNIAGHGQSSDPTVYNMWFVATTDGGATYGRAAVPGNGVVISDDVITDNRYDTLAHEIGHDFGFDHTPVGTADYANFLMSVGRSIPQSAADVFPAGTVDKISGSAPAV